MKQEAGYIGRPMLSNYVPCGMYIASKPILSGYGAMTGYHFYTDPFDETVEPKRTFILEWNAPLLDPTIVTVPLRAVKWTLQR